ncbi:MAG TPA: multiheme c-type cytochrome, partial [Burkholderiales bacterium]
MGARACGECHAKQYEGWRGSHHALAMQAADDTTVLGSFANAAIRYGGITSTFFKREGRFFVNTDGPDGKLADFEVKYTFGVTPLQQYLIEFPGGRLQALSIAWDTRPREEGGQRWFHLYPKECIDHNDSLHWTGLYQNWNLQCAACHSTNLKKGYDADSRTYKTTFSEIN